MWISVCRAPGHALCPHKIFTEAFDSDELQESQNVFDTLWKITHTTATAMRHFQSKQSQKACDDWFRKHITTKEQASDPGPSRYDIYNGQSDTAARIPYPPTKTRSSAENGESNGFGDLLVLSGGRGPLPERFFFSCGDSDSGSTGHVDETLKPKQWDGKSLDENVQEVPGSRGKEEPGSSSDQHVTSETISFAGQRDKGAQLLDEDIPLLPIFRLSAKMDDIGVPLALCMATENRYLPDEPVPRRYSDTSETNSSGGQSKEAELRTRTYLEKNAILSLKDRVRVCNSGGRKKKKAEKRCFSDRYLMGSTGKYDPARFEGRRDKESVSFVKVCSLW